MSKRSVAPGDLYTDDAYYRPIEASLEQKYNLPSGLLADIRKKGERSNKHAVSPGAGARSVYQIIPSTRDLFRQKYGVDAYAGDAAAAEVAAIHLRDSLKRNDGNVIAAIREYHGGPDRSKWGPVNADYARRVTGKAVANPQVPGQEVSRGTTIRRSQRTSQEVEQIGRALWDGGLTPRSMGTRKPLEPRPISDREVRGKPSGAEAIYAASPSTAPQEGDFDADFSQGDATFRQAARENLERQSVTFGEKLGAAIDSDFLSAMVKRNIDRNVNASVDPSWADKWVHGGADEAAKYAQSEDELEILLDPSSQDSEANYLRNKEDVDRRRRNQQILGSDMTGVAMRVGASILDPAGLALGVATGGVANAVRVGRAAKAGIAAAEVGKAGAVSTAIEAAAGNVLFTGLMDATGEPIKVEDYLMAGVAGAAIGTALHGVSRIAGRADVSDHAQLDAIQSTVSEEISGLRAMAITELGEDATEDAIQSHMAESLNNRANRIMAAQLGEVDDADKLLPDNIEDSLTELAPIGASAQEAAPVRRNIARRANEEGFGHLTEAPDQYMALELNDRAKAIVEAAGLDDAEVQRNLVERWVKAFGAESDAIALIRSESPILKATGIELLEATTGLGGRKPTAAVTKALLDRRYGEYLMGYDHAYTSWAKAHGKGWTDVNLRNTARQEFDRSVWFEVEARQAADYVPHSDPSVVRAADALEAGYQVMGDHLRAAKVLGSANIPLSARGYISHYINAGKLLGLTEKQKRRVEKVYADQLVTLNSYSYKNEAGETVTKRFDRKFSNALAKRILEEARGRARGNAYIPANLQTPEAADIVRQAIKASGLLPSEQEAALNAFRRGGQSYTKGRLKLDMTADIGDGMQLGDIFVQDIQTLYRNYARKASGDVALARYGIRGKQTLELMRNVADHTGATKKELQAFDRIVSEFTNTPWKEGYQSQGLKNASALTSAAQLGGMVFTQAGEQANAMMAVGVRATLASIPEMGRIWRSLGQWKKGGTVPKSNELADLDEIYGYIGGDDYHSTRLFDAPEQNVEVFGQESLGFFSKFARASSYMTMVASGFRALHAVQVRGLSENIVRKALRYIKLGEADKALRDMGVTDEMIRAFKTEMDAGRLVSFDKRGNITGPVDFIGSQLDPAMIHAFAQTVERGAGQIIQRTFIGETGAWAHNDLLKLLLKFRTFGLTSMEKQQGRQWRLGGGGHAGAMRLFAINLGAMGFALPIHMARLQVQSIGMSRKERDEFFEKRGSVVQMALATTKYVSALGLAPDAMDVTLGVASGWANTAGYKLPEAMTGGRGAGFQGGVSSLNPVLGLADNALKGLAGNPKNALRTLPGSNLPFVTPFWNGLEALGSE